MKTIVTCVDCGMSEELDNDNGLVYLSRKYNCYLDQVCEVNRRIKDGDLKMDNDGYLVYPYNETILTNEEYRDIFECLYSLLDDSQYSLALDTYWLSHPRWMYKIIMEINDIQHDLNEEIVKLY